MRLAPAAVLLTLALATAASAQAPPRGAPASLRPWLPPRADSLAMWKSVEAGNLAYLDAFKRGDAAGLASLYDPEAVQMRRGGLLIRGRAAVGAAFGDLLRRIRFINGSITSSQRWKVDDLVYDLGHYTFVFQPVGRDTLVEKSGYLNVWKQGADGTWRIYRDMSIPRE